jgi:hypothetical protein
MTTRSPSSDRAKREEPTCPVFRTRSLSSLAPRRASAAPLQSSSRWTKRAVRSHRGGTENTITLDRNDRKPWRRLNPDVVRLRSGHRWVVRKRLLRSHDVSHDWPYLRPVTLDKLANVHGPETFSGRGVCDPSVFRTAADLNCTDKDYRRSFLSPLPEAVSSCLVAASDRQRRGRFLLPSPADLRPVSPAGWRPRCSSRLRGATSCELKKVSVPITSAPKRNWAT